jgi:hypothetical protein
VDKAHREHARERKQTHKCSLPDSICKKIPEKAKSSVCESLQFISPAEGKRKNTEKEKTEKRKSKIRGSKKERKKREEKKAN